VLISAVTDMLMALNSSTAWRYRWH